MARRWLPVVLSIALGLQLGACGNGNAPDPRAGKGSREAVEGKRRAEAQVQARAKRRRRHERCLRERPALEAAMAELRRAESALAQVKSETRVPLPPPPPWNDAVESRFRLEDRELDRQRHEEARANWRQREESDRLRWRAAHQERLGEAQGHLNRQARVLRDRRPDLFTGPGSIEFNPAVEDQIRQCDRATAGTMGKTAPTAPSPTASSSVTITSHSDTLQ
ncbi:MAG: hypothetical protein VKP70_07195 [Cyanobacteriota bacterium]|nr:hypothetical protein [Cyanobacteriota bacterium]